MRTSWLAVGVMVVLAVDACAEVGVSPAGPCLYTQEAQRVLEVGRSEAIDLVIVSEHEGTIAVGLDGRLGDMVERLLRGDLELDGTPEFAPATSVRVARIQVVAGASPRAIAEDMAQVQWGGLPTAGALVDWQIWDTAREPRDEPLVRADAELALVSDVAGLDLPSLGDATTRLGFQRAIAVVGPTEGSALLDALLLEIAAARCPFCMWDRPVDARGRIPCERYELLPPSGPFSRCADLPGRTRMEVVIEDGAPPRELCIVAQLELGERAGEPGWYYDDASERTALLCGGFARIVWAPGTIVPPGAEQRLECLRVAGTPSPWCDSAEPRAAD